MGKSFYEIRQMWWKFREKESSRFKNGRIVDVEFMGLNVLPLTFGNKDKQLFTCALWDKETRLCTKYEDRPRMCVDFPYGKPCHKVDEGCTIAGREPVENDPKNM
jgi:Fe-S-cluster containining protein